MKMFSAFALAGVSLLLAGPASATTGCPKPALQFESDDTGVITWQSQFGRLDSPLDPNKARLALHVLNQDGNDYAAAYGLCTGIENKLVGAVRNLSFDFMNSSGNPDVHIGGGAPRYSVILDTDGDNVGDTAAFLAAVHCNVALAEDTRWSRSDFTGRTLAGCTIFVGVDVYTSDGVKSAWRLMAEAHPNYKVTQVAFLIVDEPGTSFVDRLAFHNKMFIQSGTGSAAIKNCPSEASC